MAITRTAMIDDDGSGTTGTILNNAWKQELYTQIDAADLAAAGVWQQVPFNALNFINFTVTPAQVTTNRYVKIGRTVFWVLTISGATIPGATGNLAVTVPGGLPAQVQSNFLMDHIPPGGAWSPGRAGTAGEQTADYRFSRGEHAFRPAPMGRCLC